MPDEIYNNSFSRNIGILTPPEQARLADSCVAVAGTGGIGGNTLVTLARMGVGRFRIADFDTFDYANINRQYGARTDTVGRLKIEVLAEEVQRINPSAEIETFRDGFTDENGDRILAGAGIAIDAIDFYDIETHIRFHRRARAHGLFIVMGSPVGFSGCLQVFDPSGMSLEEYCGIQPGMSALEKQLRYACGLVPELAHIEYFDVSAGASNTDFLARKGPSLACACSLASSLVAAETVLILLGRRASRPIPHSFQFDPYTFRYEKSFVAGGMTNYNPDRAIAKMPDRGSLVPQVLNLFFSKNRARKAKVNGAEIYYRMDGAGPDLLLISPLGADASFWARQVQAFARQFRVITFDSRGTGASTPILGECSTEALAEDAIALLNELGVQKCHIAGLALGGLVAQHMAVKCPGLVTSLVLASSYAVADDHMRHVTAEWRHVASENGMEALFDRCVEWLFSNQYVTGCRDELEKLRTFYHLTLQDPGSFREQSLAGIRHYVKNLSEITCPTLVIHGGADRLVSREHAANLARSIDNARISIIEPAPHFLTWEYADLFNAAVLEFLIQSPVYADNLAQAEVMR